MSFTDTFLGKLSSFLLGFSIIIGFFSGWVFSDLLIDKFKKKGKNYRLIIFLKLIITLSGGVLLSFIIHYILDVLNQ